MTSDIDKMSLRSASTMGDGSLGRKKRGGRKKDKIPFFPDQGYPNIGDILKQMHNGTIMLKLKGNKFFKRHFFIDEHGTNIRWKPSRKGSRLARIHIASVIEIREGANSMEFVTFDQASIEPECCLSIFHGELNKSLDLIAQTRYEAEMWVIGIKYLLNCLEERVRLSDNIITRQTARDKWLMEAFELADISGESRLPVDQTIRLMKELNPRLNKRNIMETLYMDPLDDENDLKEKYLTMDEFMMSYKQAATPPDIYRLMLKYSNSKEYMSTEDLGVFLQVEQQVQSNIREVCLGIIETFELVPELVENSCLGVDGFSGFMFSNDGDVVLPCDKTVIEDMSKPLNYYYINSSHNSYLTGDQLLSESSADKFRQLLLSGVRYLEIDCWDGDQGEPVVYHGYTLTSKILFRDIVWAVHRYGFRTSPFPVILAIENHCSLNQQRKMATYLIAILGEKLKLKVIQEELRILPSPKSLIGKVIVMGKKLKSLPPGDQTWGEVSDENSADELPDEYKITANVRTDNRKRKKARKEVQRALSTLRKTKKAEDEDDISLGSQASLSTMRASSLTDISEGGDSGTTDSRRSSSRKNGSLSGRFHKLRSNSSSNTKSKNKSRNSFPMVSVEYSPPRDSYGHRAPLPLSDSDGDSEDEEILDNYEQRRKQYLLQGRTPTLMLSRQMSELIQFLRATSYSGQIDQQGFPNEVVRVDEDAAQLLAEREAIDLGHFTKIQLVCVHPSPRRVDSSNLDPFPLWNSGCQVVTLNHQTEDRILKLNRALFNINGNCGYVLKPELLLRDEIDFDPNATGPMEGVPPKSLTIRLIQLHSLPRRIQNSLRSPETEGEPVLEVEVLGLKVDNSKQDVKASALIGKKPQEKVMKFVINYTDFAMLRVSLYDSATQDGLVAEKAIPICCISPGFRFIHLEGSAKVDVLVHSFINDHIEPPAVKKRASWFFRSSYRRRSSRLSRSDPVILLKSQVTEGDTLNFTNDVLSTLSRPSSIASNLDNRRGSGSGQPAPEFERSSLRGSLKGIKRSLSSRSFRRKNKATASYDLNLTNKGLPAEGRVGLADSSAQERVRGRTEEGGSEVRQVVVRRDKEVRSVREPQIRYSDTAAIIEQYTRQGPGRTKAVVYSSDLSPVLQRTQPKDSRPPDSPMLRTNATLHTSLWEISIGGSGDMNTAQNEGSRDTLMSQRSQSVDRDMKNEILEQLRQQKIILPAAYSRSKQTDGRTRVTDDIAVSDGYFRETRSKSVDHINAIGLLQRPYSSFNENRQPQPPSPVAQVKPRRLTPIESRVRIKQAKTPVVQQAPAPISHQPPQPPATSDSLADRLLQLNNAIEESLSRNPTPTNQYPPNNSSRPGQQITAPKPGSFKKNETKSSSTSGKGWSSEAYLRGSGLGERGKPDGGSIPNVASVYHETDF